MPCYSCFASQLLLLQWSETRGIVWTLGQSWKGLDDRFITHLSIGYHGHVYLSHNQEGQQTFFLFDHVLLHFLVLECDISPPEGPHPFAATGLCCVPDSMCKLPKGLFIGLTTGHYHLLKKHRRALVAGNVMQSEVAELACNDFIDWENAKVIDCHRYFCQRCALKVWHVRTEHHTMNQDESPLPSVYNPFVRQPCPHHWLTSPTTLLCCLPPQPLCLSRYVWCACEFLTPYYQLPLCFLAHRW